jgi:hypothetical protein
MVFIALLSVSDARAQGADAPNAVEAVWQKQTMDFHYRSEKQYLTCAELETRLGAALVAIGVYRVMNVATLCPREFSGNIRATITLAAPVEATRANVKSVTTFTGAERLLAHINQTTLPTASSIERFPAQWRTVSLPRDAAVRMGSADCDLLDALSKQVLPRLSVRIIRDVPGCLAPRITPRLIEA